MLLYKITSNSSFRRKGGNNLNWRKKMTKKQKEIDLQHHRNLLAKFKTECDSDEIEIQRLEKAIELKIPERQTRNLIDEIRNKVELTRNNIKVTERTIKELERNG